MKARMVIPDRRESSRARPRQYVGRSAVGSAAATAHRGAARAPPSLVKLQRTGRRGSELILGANKPGEFCLLGLAPDRHADTALVLVCRPGRHADLRHEIVS